MKSSTRLRKQKRGPILFSSREAWDPRATIEPNLASPGYFDCELKIHEEALAEVTEFFVSRGRETHGVNRQQAALPVWCTKITNPIGTAPGMWFEKKDTTGGQRKVFVSMPACHSR